jgi:hypothetical protein
METETLELIKSIVEDFGYSINITNDGTIEVHAPFCKDKTKQNDAFTAMVRVMEITVDGPKLTCKCDHLPIGVKAILIDLYYPNSLDKLRDLLSTYEESSRKTIDAKLMRVFARGRYWDV